MKEALERLKGLYHQTMIDRMETLREVTLNRMTRAFLRFPNESLIFKEMFLPCVLLE